MEHLKEFLDTSTIHGFSWISGTKRFARLSWILIVIGGFSGAGYLIYSSFHNWEQSPISTTVETLPISQITFPNVTVCPREKSFLNLNHDIKQSENVKLDNSTRKELFAYALDVIQDEFYIEIMSNLSKVEDPDRYYNWYHGYTEIKYPYFKTAENENKLIYWLHTSATSGNISTKYFGEKFDTNKVEGNIDARIYVHVPPSVRGNVQLMLNIEKITMKDISDDGKVYLYIYPFGFTDVDLTHWYKNITAPNPSQGFYYIHLKRKVSSDDIQNMDLDVMPGFRFTWKYSKLVKLSIWDGYSRRQITKEFTR